MKKHCIDNLLLLAAFLLFTGCGYRAPLHPSYIPEITGGAALPGTHADYRQLAALMEKDTGMKPTDGNTVTILPDGIAKWDILKAELENARRSIYIDHYRFCTDSLGSIVEGILKEKARQGVDVRVILDKGANTREHLQELSTLRNEGVSFELFRFPVFLLDYVWPAKSTHRDHRKILLLDGRTGYLGGRNIQNEYFLEWRDADIRITGPAVADLSAVYMENQQRVAPDMGPVYVAPHLEEEARLDRIPQLRQFTDVTVQIVHDSPTDRILPVRNCFEWALQNARRYFWFYNPYTPPPPSTIKALKDAAKRGVDVRWIVPAINDVAPEKWMGESMYRELTDAGVRIFEWQDQVLHTKQFMMDGELLGMGSANMDNLSFFLNYEVMALVYDEELTRHAADTFLAELKTNCLEITRVDLRSWSVFRRLRNRLTRILGGPLG